MIQLPAYVQSWLLGLAIVLGLCTLYIVTRMISVIAEEWTRDVKKKWDRRGNGNGDGNGYHGSERRHDGALILNLESVARYLDIYEKDVEERVRRTVLAEAHKKVGDETLDLLKDHSKKTDAAVSTIPGMNQSVESILRILAP